MGHFAFVAVVGPTSRCTPRGGLLAPRLEPSREAHFTFMLHMSASDVVGQLVLRARVFGVVIGLKSSRWFGACVVKSKNVTKTQHHTRIRMDTVVTWQQQHSGSN
ncbi:hypothetical protein LSAT2_011505 [Lamellibrachia satsuma]|nr:hypothetical protein LSAT2_011505 [Lamellibrachia satsuma]